MDINLHHPKIAYLRNALLADEEMLSQLEIKVGILGHNRSDYDIMLMPHEPEKPPEPTEIGLPDERSRETRKSIFATKILVSVLSLAQKFSLNGYAKDRMSEIFSFHDTKEQVGEIESLPELIPEVFPVKEIQETNGRYGKIREKARIKWILREMKRRQRRRTLDSYSIATTLD